MQLEQAVTHVAHRFNPLGNRDRENDHGCSLTVTTGQCDHGDDNPCNQSGHHPQAQVFSKGIPAPGVTRLHHSELEVGEHQHRSRDRQS